MPERESAPGVRRAIVLSGGGARGAYEAGVVRFLLHDLPARLGYAPRLDILSGTSVGALTACWLAATADQGPERAARLEAVWRGMRAEDLLRFSAGSWWGWASFGLGLLRAALDRRAPLPFSASRGLLDRAPFESIVLGAIPFEQIAKNCAAGLFHAISVTATDVSSGRAVVFLESSDGVPRHWTPDPTIVARPVEIARDHALASAAIPVVFPTVAIGGSQYVDGTVRLNTPLVPALRLGADRILVVALRAEGGEVIGARAANRGVEEPLALIGKVMSALLLDHVEADLGRLRFVNEMLRRGARTFGPDYLDRLNEAARREDAQPLKIVDEAVIRPSEDPRALRVRKQKFAETSAPKSAPTSPPANEHPSRHVPAAIRRAVWKRDGGRCTFTSADGRRCDSREFVEFDHIHNWVESRSHSVGPVSIS